MTLRKIPNNEFALLLYRLDCLAYGDPERVKLEKELRQVDQHYHDLLAALDSTVKVYEAIAIKIRAKHPLNAGDKGVPVNRF